MWNPNLWAAGISPNCGYSPNEDKPKEGCRMKTIHRHCAVCGKRGEWYVIDGAFKCVVCGREVKRSVLSGGVGDVKGLDGKV